MEADNVFFCFGWERRRNEQRARITWLFDVNGARRSSVGSTRRPVLDLDAATTCRDWLGRELGGDGLSDDERSSSPRSEAESRFRFRSPPSSLIDELRVDSLRLRRRDPPPPVAHHHRWLPQGQDSLRPIFATKFIFVPTPGAVSRMSLEELRSSWERALLHRGSCPECGRGRISHNGTRTRKASILREGHVEFLAEIPRGASSAVIAMRVGRTHRRVFRAARTTSRASSSTRRR